MRNNSVTMTVSAMITLDMAVLQPALWFTAERENAPGGNRKAINLSTYGCVHLLAQECDMECKRTLQVIIVQKCRLPVVT
jgi:hypothetical protein